MGKLKILIFILFFDLYGCQNKGNLESNGAALFKKVSEVFKKNPTNTDSLFYAIDLLDSAIHIDSNQLKFYFTKCQISMRLKKYDIVIKSCSKILTLDKNNFLATLEKGIAIELGGNQDSAMRTYKSALCLLVKTKFYDSTTKEYQRILMFGLLRDTTTFDLKLKEFNNYFKGQKGFQDYYQDLINFNRANYINSY